METRFSLKYMSAQGAGQKKKVYTRVVLWGETRTHKLHCDDYVWRKLIMTPSDGHEESWLWLLQMGDGYPSGGRANSWIKIENERVAWARLLGVMEFIIHHELMISAMLSLVQNTISIQEGGASLKLKCWGKYSGRKEDIGLPTPIS